MRGGGGAQSKPCLKQSETKCLIDDTHMYNLPTQVCKIQDDFLLIHKPPKEMINADIIQVLNQAVTIYKNPNTYKVLEELRQQFKNRFRQFPEAYCPDASKAIFHVLEGMTVVCGSFDHKNESHNHCWIYDRTACCYVDITGDQFKGSVIDNMPIVIVPFHDDLAERVGYNVTSLTSTKFHSIMNDNFHNVHDSIDVNSCSLIDLFNSSEILKKAYTQTCKRRCLPKIG